MKHMRKPSTVWIIFLILFISMSLMLIAGESVIHIARQELETRALETTKAEIGHISDALYAQLTSIQMENTEILNNESVLALAMRSSILDKFEMVSYKSAIMKLMRTELSRTNIATKAQLYIPTVRTIITPQKAVEVSDEELQELLSIVTAFPNGLYYTEGEIGFWSASPLIYNAAAARDSRISKLTLCAPISARFSWLTVCEPIFIPFACISLNSSAVIRLSCPTVPLTTKNVPGTCSSNKIGYAYV